MKITDARYIDPFTIHALVDDLPTSFTAQDSDSRYAFIVENDIEVTAYSSKATLEDYKALRDSEMDYVDIKKANAGKFDDFTTEQKADYKTWQQSMRDSPEDSSITDAVVLLERNDVAGLKNLMPTKPDIIA